MTLTLLTKQELSLKNKRTLKYDLMTAEKEYQRTRHVSPLQEENDE